MSFDRQGIVVVLSGSSGSGKTSLCREALKTMPSLTYSISHTTRLPRPTESNGRDYHFVSVEEFDRMIEMGQFLEWALVYNNKYGTSRQAILDGVAQGSDYILDLDHQGAQNLKALVPNTVTVFILPPSLSVLKRRLEERRTDSAETIAFRISKAVSEMKELDKYDYIVTNADFSQSLQKVQAIITAEQSKTALLKNWRKGVDALVKE